MNDDELAGRRSVAFYAAGVAAWHASAQGQGRSLLHLSAGGLGLLVALLVTVGAPDGLTFALFAAASACLLGTLGCVLVLFRRRQAWIEKAIASGTVGTDPDRLEQAALVAFALGALLTAGAGISAGWHAGEARDAATAITRLQLQVTRILPGTDAATVPVPAPAASAASASTRR